MSLVHVSECTSVPQLQLQREESPSLLRKHAHFLVSVTHTYLCEAAKPPSCAGTAFIFAEIFDEYTYHSETPASEPSSQDSQNDEQINNAAFEIPLNTLIECINIFGTAGPASTNNNSASKFKKWKKAGEDSDHDDNDEGGRGRGRGNARGIESYFSGGSDKRTGMRMTYAGTGYPLTLLM